MARNELAYLRRDVDLTAILTNSPLVPPANKVTGFWVAAQPAGFAASLQFGSKQSVPIAANLTWEMDDCTAENEGISISTTVAAAGQVITIIFFLDSGVLVQP